LSDVSAKADTVVSQVPARIDRLLWARWHWLVIAALGITWILDGLEVTIVGVIASVLIEPVSGPNLSGSQIGLARSIYIVGAITGALIIDKFWGWRIAFGLGGILGIGILLIRRYLPESPRWLAAYGRSDEAERIVGGEGAESKELPNTEEEEDR
jgi:MFS family permease